MARACTRCDHQNADDAKFCRECGAMLEMESAENADPLIGRVLMDRYRIKEVLGEGGMGRVYLAEQKMGTATREVAVKTLHPELSSDPQLVARFHRECQTVINLHSPNTVKFFDFGELEDKTLFIVMELIKGEDLAKRLDRGGALAPELADKILIQVCNSLAEAHDLEIVHRDLKPENVLLTDRGGHQDYVKVLDFGIAKPKEGDDPSTAKLTKQGMILGTPPYMSPEQFSGEALDSRSDIYSLGVMAYEMVIGDLPFQAKTAWEWATKHMTEQPTPLETFPHGAALPEHKRAAIMRALQKSREQRQSSVLEFMQEFTGTTDSQQAWTMSTNPSLSSSGVGVGRESHGTGRTAVGTPHPSSSSQPGNRPITDPMAATAYGMPGVQTPPHGHTGPMGPYPTGGMAVQSGSFPLGKVLAGLAVALLIVGGAAGGTIYLLLRGPEEVASSGPAAAAAAAAADTTSGVPSTPSTMNGTEATAGADAPDTTTPTAVEAAATMTAPSTMETPSALETPSAMDPAAQAADTSSMTTTMAATMTTQMATTMTRPSGMDRPTNMGRGDRSRGTAALRRGEAALNQNNLSGAISGLRDAQRVLGRNNSSVRSLRSSLGRRAANKVGILMQQGRCRPAQALYRDLRGVGAAAPSRRHFSGDWCPLP